MTEGDKNGVVSDQPSHTTLSPLAGSKGVTSIDRWVGYLGSGIFNDGFDYIEEMTGGSSQWAEYKLEQDLMQVQDYLACLMTALIDQAVYDIEQ